MWGLWWTKRHWGRFSPSTSVSPANHATNFSIIIITRGWHNRPIDGRSAEWTQLDSTPTIPIFLKNSTLESPEKIQHFCLYIPHLEYGKRKKLKSKKKKCLKLGHLLRVLVYLKEKASLPNSGSERKTEETVFSYVRLLTGSLKIHLKETYLPNHARLYEI
jgi:hypothetical protein